MPSARQYHHEGSTRRENKDDDESPLELEHVIGSGQYAGTFLSIPGRGDRYIKTMGSMVVIGELNDPSAQELLRGHDEIVSAVAISEGMIASGQLGTNKVPGHGAPVLLWRLAATTAEQDQTILYRLSGITHGVSLIKFSPDGRFVAAAGFDGVFAIWDCTNGELVFGKRYEARKPVAIFQWVSVQVHGRRSMYRIAMAQEGSAEIQAGEFFFEPSRQQWSLALAPVAMASSGLIRTYTCSTVFGSYLATGSTEGELFIFRLADTVREHRAGNCITQGGVFRTSIPLSGGTGILSLLVLPNTISETIIIVGGGDGKVKQLRGRDDKWQVVAQVQVEGAVNSLSLDIDQQLLIGTNCGKTYRLLVSDMAQKNPKQPALLTVAHVARPTAIAFGSKRSDVCCTVADDGRLVVWDLSDYGALSMSKNESRASKLGDGATCVCWLRDVSLIAGFNDAQLRCFGAADGTTEWTIPNAHRTPISALACHVDPSLAYLVSAAEDGAVRVWNIATRLLILEFNDHLKSVSKIIIDNADPMLFHTVGLDGALFTYDLRSERRTVAHVRRIPQTGLSQRHDADHELLTADLHSTLLTWDNDFSDPVASHTLSLPSIQDTSAPPRCLSVSPSGDYLALAKNETVAIFELCRNDPKLAPRLIALGHAHSDVVRDLQWSPDERQLISVADDTCLCVWNFYGSNDK